MSALPALGASSLSGHEGATDNGDSSVCSTDKPYQLNNDQPLTTDGGTQRLGIELLLEVKAQAREDGESLRHICKDYWGMSEAQYKSVNARLHNFLCKRPQLSAPDDLPEGNDLSPKAHQMLGDLEAEVKRREKAERNGQAASKAEPRRNAWTAREWAKIADVKHKQGGFFSEVLELTPLSKAERKRVSDRVTVYNKRASDMSDARSLPPPPDDPEVLPPEAQRALAEMDARYQAEVKRRTPLWAKQSVMTGAVASCMLAGDESESPVAESAILCSVFGP